MKYTYTVIEDFQYSHGKKVPVAILIKTTNRIAVLQEIWKHSQFNVNGLTLLDILDKFVDEKIIKYYKTNIMRLTYDELFEKK